MDSSTDLRPLYARALPAATDAVEEAAGADPRRPTPCAGWDLAALVGHLIGQNHGIAEAVETGDAPAGAYAPPAGDPATTMATAGREWRAGTERLTRAFAAAPLDRPVRLVEISAERRFPLAFVVGFQLLDTVVHTWDLATALGRPFRPDVELVAAVLDQARLIPTDGRTRPGAAFGPVREGRDADPWREALARLGRTGG